jgi:DNA-binding NtrC family response regulator
MRHKILIADDETSIRTPLMRIFGDYPVLSAKDGDDAVRIIRSEKPSLVLLDLCMPVMDGLEVLRAFKEAKDAPIFIVLTGNDELDMVEKALKLGALTYITKPFQVCILRGIVLSALKNTEDRKEPFDKPWHVGRC